MNLYIIFAIVIGWGASVAGAGWWAYGAGKDSVIAAQAIEDRVVIAASNAAASAAAHAISKQETRHVTVQGKLEREVITREVFRECHSGAPSVELFNSTLPPDPAASSPVGGVMP